MPRITSNLSTTKGFAPIEAEWYGGKIIRCDLDQKEGWAPSLSIDWEIISDDKHDGRYKGRKINFDRVMVGGEDESGKAYSLNRLLTYIGGLGITWKCKSCDADNSQAPVKQETDFLCPTCNALLDQVEIASEDFQNRQAMIQVGIKVRKTREDGKLVDAMDEEGKPIRDNVVKNVKSL